MENIFTDIALSNPNDTSLSSVQVRALVDTDAFTLCIPKHIALQLHLNTETTREVSIADSRFCTERQ